MSNFFSSVVLVYQNGILDWLHFGGLSSLKRFVFCFWFFLDVFVFFLRVVLLL